MHNVNNLGNLFFQMGDYCLERVLPIYEQYADYTVDNVLGFLKEEDILVVSLAHAFFWFKIIFFYESNFL